MCDSFVDLLLYFDFSLPFMSYHFWLCAEYIFKQPRNWEQKNCFPEADTSLSLSGTQNEELVISIPMEFRQVAPGLQPEVQCTNVFRGKSILSGYRYPLRGNLEMSLQSLAQPMAFYTAILSIRMHFLARRISSVFGKLQIPICHASPCNY